MKIQYETESYEGFPAMGTLAMALMEHTGIREYIDSMCVFDPSRRILSPGMAVKAMIGPIFGTKHKSPLCNIGLFYAAAPTCLLFGQKVERECLNDSAFGRALDTLFDADRKEMLWNCSKMCADMYSLSSDVFHLDASNISLFAEAQENRDGAAVPNYCGHAKDGRNGLVQYSMMAVTDSNGLLRCHVPYTGSTSDVVMDREMIGFLSERIDCPVSTVIADSKMANAGTIDLLFEKDLGFVTKCPFGFAQKIRDEVLEESQGKLLQCKREGARIFETLRIVNGHGLRFVVYALGDSGDAEFCRKDGEKRLKAAFSKITGTEYNCEPDARQALEGAMEICDSVAYDVTAQVVPYEVKVRRPTRGRPRKGSEDPGTETKYRIEVSWEFDTDTAERMGRDHGTQVLVTNLPRSDEKRDNPRDGADAETILELYLDEYKVEHTYRLMKSGLGVDEVYLHTPERENAMQFVISIATILSNVIDAVLARMPGVRVTADRLCWKMISVSTDYNREDDCMMIRGYEGASKEFFRYLEQLDVFPGLLLGHK